MLLTLLSIWLAGAIGMYILDGFFDFSLESLIKTNDWGVVIFVCSFWWLIGPFALLDTFRDVGKNHRKKRQEAIKEVEKLRVAAQKEVDEAMIEVERDAQVETKNSRWP